MWLGTQQREAVLLIAYCPRTVVGSQYWAINPRNWTIVCCVGFFCSGSCKVVLDENHTSWLIELVWCHDTGQLRFYSPPGRCQIQISFVESLCTFIYPACIGWLDIDREMDIIFWVSSWRSQAHFDLCAGHHSTSSYALYTDQSCRETGTYSSQLVGG